MKEKHRLMQRQRQPRLSTEVAWLFPRQGEWMEEDYLALPDTNHIVELSEGRVVIPAMPTTSHQRAVRNLLRAMDSHAQAHGLGEVCVAPLRVRLWPGKFREPDLVFMSTAHTDRIGEEFWEVPDLVVEVISPRTERSSGTERTDRLEKFEEYARAGVTEYWLVDPKEHTIEVYVLQQRGYHLLGRWGVRGIARSEVLGGFAVPVTEIVGE